MHIKKFPPMPDFLYERFVSFENDFNGKSWQELYNAINFLKAEYPDRQFRDQPYVYVDIENMTSGFLFIDGVSDEVFYVYKQ